MHLSLIFNPINIFFTFLASLGSVVIYRKILFNSQSAMIATLQSELEVYRKKVDRIEEEGLEVLKKDKVTERRMLELEAANHRSKIQTQLHREEIEMLQEIITRCMPIILSQANGNKAGIEAKLGELKEFQKEARHKMIAYDDEQLIFRVYADP